MQKNIHTSKPNSLAALLSPRKVSLTITVLGIAFGGLLLGNRSALAGPVSGYKCPPIGSGIEFMEVSSCKDNYSNVPPNPVDRYGFTQYVSYMSQPRTVYICTQTNATASDSCGVTSRITTGKYRIYKHHHSGSSCANLAVYDPSKLHTTVTTRTTCRE